MSRQPPQPLFSARLRIILERWLAIIAVLTLFTWGAYRATSPEVELPALAALLAELSEIDKLLDTEYQPLLHYAQQHRAERLIIPNFPVDLQIDAEAILHLGPEQLRDHILTQGAQKLYQYGLIEAISLGEGSTDFEVALPLGLRWLVGPLGQEAHRLASLGLLIMTGVAAISMLTTLAVAGIRRTSFLVGLILTIASTALTLVVWIISNLALWLAVAESDPFIQATMSIGASWLGALWREYIVVMAVSLAYMGSVSVALALLGGADGERA